MKHKEVKLVPIPESIQLIEMNDEEYFGPKWADWISNSKLSLINPEQGGSPEMYKEGLSEHQKYSDSLYFGGAVHELILQPESFILEKSVNRPTAKAGFMADELYSIWLDKGDLSDKDIINASYKINYYKDKMNKERIKELLIKTTPYFEERKKFESSPSYLKYGLPIYLDPKSRNKLELCLKSVSDNSNIQELLHPKGFVENPISMNEAALFMDIEAEFNGKKTILKLKGKLDNFTINLETNEIVLNDLKTTGHILPMFKDSFKKYHYSRQMAKILVLYTVMYISKVL